MAHQPPERKIGLLRRAPRSAGWCSQMLKRLIPIAKNPNGETVLLKAIKVQYFSPRFFTGVDLPFPQPPTAVDFLSTFPKPE